MFVNIPLVDALLQISRYAKLLKEFLKKKNKVIDVETIEMSRYYSAMMANNLSPKRDDPRAFTISCIIGVYMFNKALCDQRASINLMPLMIFENLGLVNPQPTPMRLLMADFLIKKSVGILSIILGSK